MKRTSLNLFLLLTGQIMSVFGSSLHLVVVIVFLKEMTESAVSIGLFQLAAYLPIVLLAPLGGLTADSTSSKRVLILSDILRGIVMLGMAVLVLYNALTFTRLLIGTFFVSIGTAFFQPALHALFPGIIEKQQLKQANALKGSALLGSNFAGTSIGGIAYVFLGPAAIFLYNGLSFLISAGEESFIKPIEDKAKSKSQGGVRSISIIIKEAVIRMREAREYVKENRGVLSAIVTYGIMHALYPPVIIGLPFLLEQNFGMGAEPYGYALALLIAGGGAGAVSYGFFAPKRSANALLLSAGFITISGLLMVIWIFPLPWVLFPSLFIAGLALGTVHQIMTTSLYRKTAADSRGMLFGIMESFASAALPVSYGISGVLVGLFRGRLPLFFGLTGVFSLIVIGFILTRKRLPQFVIG